MLFLVHFAKVQKKVLVPFLVFCHSFPFYKYCRFPFHAIEKYYIWQPINKLYEINCYYFTDVFCSLYAQKTPIIRLFSKRANQSATYKETIAYYSLLAKDFPSKSKEMGLTDSGERRLILFDIDKN
jgi:hypothetical protein